MDHGPGPLPHGDRPLPPPTTFALAPADTTETPA